MRTSRKRGHSPPQPEHRLRLVHRTWLSPRQVGKKRPSSALGSSAQFKPIRLAVGVRDLQLDRTGRRGQGDEAFGENRIRRPLVDDRVAVADIRVTRLSCRRTGSHIGVARIGRVDRPSDGVRTAEGACPPPRGRFQNFIGRIHHPRLHPNPLQRLGRQAARIPQLRHRLTRDTPTAARDQRACQPHPDGSHDPLDAPGPRAVPPTPHVMCVTDGDRGYHPSEPTSHGGTPWLSI